MPLPLALAVFLPLPPPQAQTPHAHPGEAPHVHALAGDTADWVYYDYVGADGALQGGRVRLEPRGESQAAQAEAAVSGVVTLLDNGPVENRLDLVFVGDGYTAAQLGTYAGHVSNIWPVMLAETPLDEYASLFNIHRVDVVSNQSGVDNDPFPGVLKDTALDMEFWCSGIDRLLCVNVGKANIQAYLAPDRDQVVALANSTTYGGAGYSASDLATVSGGNFSSIEIVLHEVGHALGDLADEYDYGGPATYVGSEPWEPNVSIYTTGSMASLLAKWHLWLGEAGVGTFQGAKYSQFGIYRPTFNSKMRNLGAPFDPINAEQLVAQLYAVVDPIDDATPAGTYMGDAQLFVDPIDPVQHALDVQWLADGALLPGATGLTLSAAALGFAPGLHQVSVRVTDNTSFVRDAALRAALLTEERTWTIAVPSNPQPPVATAVVQGGGWISGAGAIKLTGAFLDTATSAQVGGKPATIVSKTFDQLTLAAGVLAPGSADVVVAGPGGASTLADALVIAPTLDVSSTGIGGTLTAELDMGSTFNGLYVMAVAGAGLPAPFVVPGIYHGLELDPGAAFQVVGSGPFLQEIALLYPVPAQPALAGATLYLQGFVTRYALPFTSSFTNLAQVTF